MRHIALVLLSLVVPLAVTGEAPAVLVLLADGFNRGEYYRSALPLRALGYRVVVAGIERGTVFCSLEGRPDKQGRDVEADLALGEVEVDDYLGLVLPGGYSPGNLERHAESLVVCKRFMVADKPVAGICHGPRLLMRADLLAGRRVTCLYSVANELADAWRERAYGTYLDRPVVVDGNLVTSRYPGDLNVFTRTVAARLAEAGGLPVPEGRRRVLVVQTVATTGHAKWALRDAPGMFGVQVDLVGDPQALTKLMGKDGFAADAYDALITVPGEGTAAVTAGDAWAQLVKAADPTPVAVEPAPTRYQDLVRPIMEIACRVPGHAVEETDPADDAEALAPLADLTRAVLATQRPVVLALRRGFDDAVVELVREHFTAAGCPISVVHHEPGEAVGLNGSTIETTCTYFVSVVPDDALIVAPGGVFPEKSDRVRQAEQPAWLKVQADRDAARHDWLMARWRGGSDLVVVGFDALRLARDPVFKGKKFACSDQAVWSFPKKTAGAYAHAPVHASAERLLSVESAAVLEEALAAE